MRASKLIYKTVAGKDLRLLCVRPEGWNEADCRTAVVWIHGGGWVSGYPEMFLRHCEYFAARGAVAFSVEYRLLDYPQDPPIADSGNTVADCLTDCKSAVRYLRANAAALGIDPRRIVAAGDSAGGHLAACLGTIREFDAADENHAISAMADCVVNCNGIVDMTGKWRSKISPALYAANADAAEDWMAGHRMAAGLSPLYHISAGQPPALLLHGLRDTVVPPEEAAHYYDAQLAAGNVAELTLYPEFDHSFILYRYRGPDAEADRAIARMDEFLVAHGFLKADEGRRGQ